MGFFSQLADWISKMPSPDAPIVATLAVGAELLMRYIPSQKALGVIHSISQGCHVIGTGLGKLADLTDKIFGQNVVPAPQLAAPPAPPAGPAK